MPSAFAVALWLALEAMVQIRRRWRGELPPALSLDAAVTLDHSDGSATVRCDVAEGPPCPAEIPVDGKLVVTHQLGEERISAIYHGSATVSPGEDSCEILARAWKA